MSIKLHSPAGGTIEILPFLDDGKQIKLSWTLPGGGATGRTAPNEFRDKPYTIAVSILEPEALEVANALTNGALRELVLAARETIEVLDPQHPKLGKALGPFRGVK